LTRGVDVKNLIFTSYFLQRDLGPKKLLPVSQRKRIRLIWVAAKRQRELIAVIAHTENDDILSAEWLDEDDVEQDSLNYGSQPQMWSLSKILG